VKYNCPDNRKTATMRVANRTEDVRAAHREALERFPSSDPDADGDVTGRFEATLAYLWDHCRAAAYVVVRDWRVRAFVPFANHPGFRNAWSHQLDLAEGCGDEPLAPEAWWCNADVLCTRPAGGDAGWSVGTLPVYLEMFRAALRAHPVRHASFFLNRRDHPLLRRDGRCPYAHVWRGGEPPPSVLANPDDLLPILSPYTDAAVFADRVVCTDVCWRVLDGGGGLVPPDVPSVPWRDRRRAALFRGTATSALRIQLVEAVQGDASFDVALTHSAGGRLVAEAGTVRRLGESGSRDAWLDPAEWTRYRVVLAPDGHAALNRWALLVRSGAWIVRISRSAAPETMLSRLVPHEHVDGTRPGWEDRLRAVVAKLVRRRRGPTHPHDLRDKVLAEAAAALSDP
jgi:hypothetical protein